MRALWQTPEWREKMRVATSVAHKAKWADPQWRASVVAAQNAGKRTPQAKAKRTAMMRRRWQEEPTLRITVTAALERGRRKTWGDPEKRKMYSQRMTRRHQETDLEDRIRQGIKRSWAGNVQRRDQYAARLQNTYGRYEYLDRKGRLWNLRSGDGWERGFARWLDVQGLNWRYEPDRLVLSDGRIYIPDFWVEEWQTYVEIKGARPESIEKVHVALRDGYAVLFVAGRSAMRKLLRCLT